MQKRMNRIKGEWLQSLREIDILVGYHGNGSEEQHKDDQHEEAKRAALSVQRSDIIQRLRADIAQPEQNKHPQQPAKVERAEREVSTGQAEN